MICNFVLAMSSAEGFAHTKEARFGREEEVIISLSQTMTGFRIKNDLFTLYTVQPRLRWSEA